MGGYTERIRLFTDQTLAKNASIVNATPIPMRTFGPNTSFGLDINASRPGSVVLTYQIAMDAEGTYYTPNNATPLNIPHRGGGASTGSRDYYADLTIFPAPYVKFKAQENNASNMVLLSADLIVQG